MKKIIKGQSTLEYAVLIGLVIAALVFMGWIWFRGAYQKKIMTSADEISGGGQFDIDYTTITLNQIRNSRSSETITGTNTGVTFNTSTTETLNSTETFNTPTLQARRGGR
ncbi:MAG: hypothetical protein NC912_03765 [Candidatus Omnitrophica bacterium]|nr:hypothetical protein [Candidatus Omnitrophota bacterium]